MTDLVFDRGMYPEHQRKDPAELAANLAWFQRMWPLLKVGGVMATAVGRYEKTETGFRRLDRLDGCGNDGS